MSGIFGLLRFDDTPVNRRELERASQALRPYGPDHAAMVVDGVIGIGHVQMRMTPEDRFDRQPARSGHHVLITADVRLDNRDELLRRLDLADGDAADWPDSRIILHGWERFKDALWPLLRGPFAVAIWDAQARVLHLARDHLGLHPLMWHRSDRFFAFASMPNALFALEGVPRLLNEEKMADFLVLNHREHRTTMYRTIYRVRPAHVLRIESDGSRRETCFWSLSDIKPLRFRSDQDYADGLRDCLAGAVRRQMRSAHGVGCLLSGGLDSSSVAALAAESIAETGGRLASYTGMPRKGFVSPNASGTFADPTPYVEAIRHAVPNIDVDYVHADVRENERDLDRLFLALQGPVRNPSNFGWYLKLLRQAHSDGRRVLLGGLFGNVTVSWDGWAQTAGHLAHARLPTVYRQWRLFYRLTSYSRWDAFRKLCLDPLLTLPQAGQTGRSASDPAWREYSAIRPEFARDTNVDARARDTGHDFLYRMAPGDRAKAIHNADYIGEWNAAEKALTGVEVRDPTADIDVLSYCFAIPPEQWLCEGIDRALIRRAMWGRLPACVLTNRLTGTQAPDWAESYIGRQTELAARVAELSHCANAAKMIDFPRLQRAVENWPNRAWNTRPNFVEYNLVFSRAQAAARFIRWFEAAN